MSRGLGIVIVASVLAGMAPKVGAQTQLVDPRPEQGVLLPSPVATEAADATALAVNPAALGFLDAWSLTYVGAWVTDQQHLSGQGHGVYAAVPVGPVGLGAGLDVLLPPDEVRRWQGLDRRARLSFAASFNPLRSVGIGAAYRTWLRYDSGARFYTWDISLALRPINYLGVMFAFSNINRPKVGYMPVKMGVTEIPERTEKAARRFSAAVSVRPLGTDRFALGGQVDYSYGKKQVFLPLSTSFSPRMVSKTDVSVFGAVSLIDGVRLRARFGAEGLRSGEYRNGYFMDVAVHFEARRLPFGLQASPYFRLPGSHDGDFEGMSLALGFHGDVPPSVPMLVSPAYVVTVNVDAPMGPRGLVALLDRLRRAANDPSVDVVVFSPKPDTLNLEQAFSVRRALQAMERRNIDVVCYVNDVDAAAYLACTGAKAIWMDPAATVRWAGLRASGLYLGDLLQRIGVHADIVRIGEYKGAPERYTRSAPSDPVRAAMDRFMDTTYHSVMAAVAASRYRNDAALTRRIVERGPYAAQDALAKKLVDKLVGREVFEEQLENRVGLPLYFDRRYGDRPLRRRTYLDTPQVAVVYITGDITMGKSLSIPPWGVETTGAETLIPVLRDLREDPSVGAVVLRIDSPGGSAQAADQLWREVMRLREVKPVVASLGSVAASGAYYVASAADVIVAEPATLTGSIGIYFGKADVSGLLERLGVSVTTYRRGRRADMQSPARAYTAGERDVLKSLLRRHYERFLDRVATGRGGDRTPQWVDARAQGRIWSGTDARYQGLVDTIGGFSAALAKARTLGKVDARMPLRHLPKKSRCWMCALMSGKNRAQVRSVWERVLSSTVPMRVAVGALWPFLVHAPDEALARLPFAVGVPR